MFIQGQRKGSIVLNVFASIMITFLELWGSNGPPGNTGSAVPGIASNGAMELILEKIKTLFICDTLINNLFIHTKTYLKWEEGEVFTQMTPIYFVKFCYGSRYDIYHT